MATTTALPTMISDGCQTDISLSQRVTAIWQCHCPDGATFVDRYLGTPIGRAAHESDSDDDDSMDLPLAEESLGGSPNREAPNPDDPMRGVTSMLQ